MWSIHPRLTKAGFTAAGKQMLRCHECGKRFVIDHGELTYYSHQSQAKWDDLILDTEWKFHEGNRCKNQCS
jgi:transposase-like protein